MSAQTINRLWVIYDSHTLLRTPFSQAGDIFFCGGVSMGHIPMTHGVDINPHSHGATKIAGAMLTAEALGMMNMVAVLSRRVCLHLTCVG